MPVSTHVYLSAVPADNLEEWFRREIRYPVSLRRDAEADYTIESGLHFSGRNGQTLFDLHAASVLYMVMNLIPRGVDLYWQNNAIMSMASANTARLEYLADSFTAKNWISQVVRPTLSVRFPLHTF